MWQQISAIVWAQFRITRNHMPRMGLSMALGWFLPVLWYGLFTGFACFLAVVLPNAPRDGLHEWLPVGLLALFLYWQTMPLMTLSGGWGLQLNKLQIYPIPTRALFSIETLLRITASPETIILLLGVVVGLLRHPGIPAGAPLLLLLFIPFNLFLQLALRDFLTFAFNRSRFREVLTILVISIGVLPQLILRTGLAHKMQPYFLSSARGLATPWQVTAALSLGAFSAMNLAVMAGWIFLSFIWARRQFQKGLLHEESFRGGVLPRESRKQAASSPLLFTRFFRDPMANLLQKELQSLTRMPRFRVVFGMACVFGVIVFVPMTLGHGGATFIKNNFLPMVNLYGMLMLSDVLLLNIFGLDRKSAQLFFVAPVSFRAVLQAKNVAALFAIAAQTMVVLLFVLLFRVPLSLFGVASSISVSAVVAVYLLSAGNLLSVSTPRAIDPSSTMRKQAGAKMQLWTLLCTLGMAVLVAFPFLARWAFQKDWTFFAVLLLEFVIGLIVYRIALDSAVELGLRNREQMVDALSKGPSPVAA
jgi:ABC-2 type transport system permease protein